MTLIIALPLLPHRNSLKPHSVNMPTVFGQEKPEPQGTFAPSCSQASFTKPPYKGALQKVAAPVRAPLGSEDLQRAFREQGFGLRPGLLDHPDGPTARGAGPPAPASWEKLAVCCCPVFLDYKTICERNVRNFHGKGWHLLTAKMEARLLMVAVGLQSRCYGWLSSRTTQRAGWGGVRA